MFADRNPALHKFARQPVAIVDIQTYVFGNFDILSGVIDKFRLAIHELSDRVGGGGGIYGVFCRVDFVLFDFVLRQVIFRR